jgi:leucine-zipper-like transcriptional regulator 1
MENFRAQDEAAASNDAMDLADSIRNVELQDVRIPIARGVGDAHQRSLRESTMQELMPMHLDMSSRSYATSSHQSLLRQQAPAPPRYVENRASASELSLTGLTASTQQSTFRSLAAAQETRNSYYSAAAARASENVLRAYNENSQNPESAPPGVAVPTGSLVQMQENSGWSLMETSSSVSGGAPPCERSLHAAAVLNGCLYVFGGYDGQTRVNDFHCFSFAEKRFSQVLPATHSGPPPSPRDRHVAVVYGNSFYVFGGFDGTSRVSDFFGFDFSSMCWREIHSLSGAPPSERHSHAAVVHGNSMYVFGGYDGSYKSDLHQFDFSQSKWSVVQAAGRRPRARYRATCVVHKNTMLLFGGHDGTRHLSDTQVFDFETRIWSALVTEGTPPIPRDSHVSVIHGNSMYIFGGSSGSAMNDLHELQLPLSSTAPAKWRQVKSNSGEQPGHRFCHVAVVHHDSMYVFGGYDGSERLNDFLRFDFAAYDLSCDVPPSTIISDFRSLVNDETLSDVTFVVEDQDVYAHKFMLMRCPYFQALFLGQMRESQLSTIRIEQVSHPIFLAVLEYLYTDEVHIPFDAAMELFEAADLYMIPRLKTMCERRMLHSISVDNAASIFHAADMHSASTLRIKALKYMLSHFEEVSKTQSFEEMGRSNMELVFEILRNR